MAEAWARYQATLSNEKAKEKGSAAQNGNVPQNKGTSKQRNWFLRLLCRRALRLQMRRTYDLQLELKLDHATRLVPNLSTCGGSICFLRPKLPVDPRSAIILSKTLFSSYILRKDPVSQQARKKRRTQLRKAEDNKQATPNGRKKLVFPASDKRQ